MSDSQVTPALADAVSLHQSGRLDEAEAVYRHVLRESPFSVDARHLLGVLEGGRDNRAGAIRLIREALSIEPDQANAYVNLGNQFHRSGQPVQAVAAYRRALRFIPDQSIARTSLPVAFKEAVSGPLGQEPIGNGDVIIHQHNPGLGDNLLYSTLPELFAARGQRVFISDMNSTRNPEIHELVWGANPHVSGVTERLPNAGMCRLIPSFESHSHILNWLTRIEVLHGFPPTNDLPRIHYKPQAHTALAGKILVDTNSSTIRYSPEAIGQFIDFIVKRFHYPRDRIVQLTFRQPGIAHSNGELDGVKTHSIGSIFELCDALASAQAFITVHSGANSLAAAIRRDAETPAIHCAVDANHYNQKCYIWRNIDYTIVPSLGAPGT